MKLSFQTILLIVFGFFTVIGIAAFAGYINLGGNAEKDQIPSGSVVIWGTINRTIMEQFISGAGIRGESIKVNYFEKNASTYESELVSAIASGIGPDIFMVTPEIYWRQRDKMYEILYGNYPVANYTATYMDIGKTYLTPTGIMAFPMFIDPLVGYWNKDIFASAGIASPPTEWRQLPEIAKEISAVSNDYVISRSAFALGEYQNISHAKEILSLLFIQAGDPISHLDQSGKIVLDFAQRKSGSTNNSAAVALDFYTQFADSSKGGVYTWNKSFKSDIDSFLSNDLAYYFGLGSELSILRKTNPNLNFDMAFVPQAQAGGAISTFGNLYGLAIAKQSQNIGLAYYVMGNMLSKEKNKIFLTGLQNSGFNIAPARRDPTPDDPSNPYAGVLYQSALVSKNWIDPNSAFTSGVWEEMVSDVQSGKSNAATAISTAQKKLLALFKTQ